MSSSYSPSSRSSPGSSRPHLQQPGFIGSASRLRSSSLKKPPEPLRRAVADCLSAPSSVSPSTSLLSSSTAVPSCSTTHFGCPAVVATEASRTLRDYLASSESVDMAYNVILDHTIAERERSPAIVSRCVALLKRSLLRYKPNEETLLQVDRFCLNIIAECDSSSNQRLSPWSRSLNQQSLASNTPISTSPFPVPTFASVSLVKSLNYLRSLVAQYIRRQPTIFSPVVTSSKHSLPSLSSLMRKSFNSQLSSANGSEPTENRNTLVLPASNLSNEERIDLTENISYIAEDVITWRWLGEHRRSLLSTESDRSLEPQEVNTCNILELGAAALLVGEIEVKPKEQLGNCITTNDWPYLDQILLFSSVTRSTDSNSVIPHLRAITASKRNKAGPRQIWDDIALNTFRPRAKPLFQYRHYSEQQPLRLNPAEVCEVIAGVSSEAYWPNLSQSTISARLGHQIGKESLDVAGSVLIKLIIDMYVLDAEIAAPLTLYMLEEMLSSPNVACRVRAFDLIMNLGIHCQLLEPVIIEESVPIDDGFLHDSCFNNKDEPGTMFEGSYKKMSALSAINTFELWILRILYDALLLLVHREEKEESVWASSLSCLLYFVCDRGRIIRKRLNGLDIRVIKALIETSRLHSWTELVHNKLVCMLTNLFYLLHDEGTIVVGLKPATFLWEQLDLIGGIEFIFFEYSIATLREERRNLYAIIFDYVLYQINDECITSGVSEYSYDEVQPIANLLTLADAPEAYYISIKLGVEGIGERLRSSISRTLSRYPSNDRLNMLLKNLTQKFDSIVSLFMHVETEFSHLSQITKSFLRVEDIANDAFISNIQSNANLAWATLHSLVHSDRIACRRNGYIWLGDLLIDEIQKRKDMTIWSNIRNLERKIAFAGCHDFSDSSDIPLSIGIMCGLLKSKNNIIRCGFLYVLERLLMQCKLLLDGNDMENYGVHTPETDTNGQHDKANAVIDLMSSALSLVAQRTETGRINILKMCDILFSQLCLKVPFDAALSQPDGICNSLVYDSFDETKKTEFGDDKNGYLDETSGPKNGKDNIYKCDTASTAAMLLRGHAMAPMKLVARIPTLLFYWPLIQLAGAATDNIALGIAVGRKGRGNLPGAASDIRAALLLLLIGKCTVDPSAFKDVDGEEFFRGLLDDTDARVAYCSASFLLKRMMKEKPDEYQHMLQNLIFKAQQSNNEKLLENPYLQMRGILQLSVDGL